MVHSKAHTSLEKSQLESEWPSLGSNSGKASSPGAKKRQLSKLPSFAAVSKPMTKPKPSESPVESNYDQVTFRLAIVIAVYLKAKCSLPDCQLHYNTQRTCHELCTQQKNYLIIILLL